MTHTLHRRGSRKSLSKDYIFLCMAAKGINEDGAADKMREFLKICSRQKAVNMGDMRTGNMYNSGFAEIIDKVTSTSIVHGVFTDIKTVRAVMKDLKEADLGISVVVSGPFSSVQEACKKVGLNPHSADYSAGIWGNTKKLPSNDVLEVCTMCGHAMVAPNLAKTLVKAMKRGEISAEEAGKELSKQCACGIFNPVRAAELLTTMASTQ
jgi:hypothetical protein